MLRGAFAGRKWLGRLGGEGITDVGDAGKIGIGGTGRGAEAEAGAGGAKSQEGKGGSVILLLGKVPAGEQAGAT